MYKVVFIIRESRIRLTREFDSPFLCRKFLNKLKHSGNVDLVSYPIL